MTNAGLAGWRFWWLSSWVSVSLVCYVLPPKQDCSYQVHIDIIPFIKILRRGTLGLCCIALIVMKITLTNNVLFPMSTFFKCPCFPLSLFFLFHHMKILLIWMTNHGWILYNFLFIIHNAYILCCTLYVYICICTCTLKQSGMWIQCNILKFFFFEVLCPDLAPWHTKQFTKQHKLDWGSLYVLVRDFCQNHFIGMQYLHWISTIIIIVLIICKRFWYHFIKNML